MKKIIILGSTGSIGKQTIEVIRKHSNDFKIVGLAAGKNWQLLKKQIKEFEPQFISTNFPEKFKRKKIFSLEELAVQKCDLVISAISGLAGLKPTLAALKVGRDVALANKESLVLAGKLVIQTAKKSKAKIFPVDSEHSGLWQLLENIETKDIKKIILTASGGALRDLPLSNLKNISPEKVLKHPTWQMGAKVTVDSATLVNKAFEVIEAHHLFGIPYEKIDVLIHPQSLVHALVETVDGNLFAQLASPDMRLPIQHALFGGKRNKSKVNFLDLASKKLEFYKPDFKRYPLFPVILKAAEKGGLAIVVAAAAAELAVEKFLKKEIGYSDMLVLIQKCLKKIPDKLANLNNILRTVEQLRVSSSQFGI